MSNAHVHSYGRIPRKHHQSQQRPERMIGQHGLYVHESNTSNNVLVLV